MMKQQAEAPQSLLLGKDIQTDMEGKDVNMKVHFLKRPHMRAFHLSWFGFFLGLYDLVRLRAAHAYGQDGPSWA
jgi:hypothetical protein